MSKVQPTCDFVDENSFKCNIESTRTSNYDEYKQLCDYHFDVIATIKKTYNPTHFPDSAFEIHKNYKYVGKHWEKCDMQGPLDIYHYILRSRIEGKSKEEIKKMKKDNDYDLEIWPGDKDWAYCSKYDNLAYESSYKDSQEQVVVEDLE